jgi:hypothetical protein
VNIQVPDYLDTAVQEIVEKASLISSNANYDRYNYLIQSNMYHVYTVMISRGYFVFVLQE